MTATFSWSYRVKSFANRNLNHTYNCNILIRAKIIQIFCRLGQSLDLTGEKTPEVTIYESLKSCATQWGVHELVEYTATESLCMEQVYGKWGSYIIEQGWF